VKELYYYQDATPTHSYCRALYKYPQCPYPYQQLIDENGRRGRDQPEFELLDSGVFAEERYFDVSVEYAKATPTDILIRLTIANRGHKRPTFMFLPTLWVIAIPVVGRHRRGIHRVARASAAGVNARLHCRAPRRSVPTISPMKPRTAHPNACIRTTTRIAHGYLEFPMSARMLRTRFTRPSF